MGWKRRVVCLLTALVMTGTCAAADGTAGGKETVTGSYRSIRRVSVHDPSICKDPETGTYYVFGTHLATAKSTDLVNWTRISGDYTNVTSNPIYGNVTENLAESFLWAGYNDGDCTGGFAVWAPDVTWDPQYLWEDGTEGAWLLYYSASSTWRRSCIGCLASRDIGGPYTYVDTLVYSGMTQTGATDGNSTRDTGWYNDYLNFNELLALGSENGGIDEINDKWFRKMGSEYNTDYAPNCIDPCIVEGNDGRWYMVYGSWSGGLFILEIDPVTGRAIYPGVDSVDEASGNYVDRYYGTHIAGGNHQSGEGPFILYDQETGYYYLYETYGSLNADGGYNMRLFRSESIYGPYVDAAGKNSAKSGTTNYKYGIKLMGNYQFSGQRAYKSAGHNSALIDDDGQRYLICHQRFGEGSEYHEVRVRQQFLNEENWPVAAVYENRNQSISHYTDGEVALTYEYVDHQVSNLGSMLKTRTVSLEADGTVSGDVTGTWTRTDSGRGYDYLTLTDEDGVVYRGFFFRQISDTGAEVMTFSAIGDNDHCIWGSAVQE